MEKKHGKLIVAIVLAAIMVFYFLFSLWVPFSREDLSFAGCYVHSNGGSADFDLCSFIKYMKGVRMYDNGRLANVMSPIFTLWLPKWAMALGASACAALMYVVMASLSSGSAVRRPKANVLLLCWLLCMVFLPWRGMVMVPDYQLNYVFSSGLCLAFIALFLRVDILPGYGRSVAYVSGSLIGLISSSMHEGFAVAVFCGLIAYVVYVKVFEKGCVCKLQWVMICAFSLGMVYVLTAPGILGRIHNEINTPSFSVFGIMKSNVPMLVICVIVAIVAALKNRRLVYDRVTVLSATSMLVGGAYCFFLVHSVHIGWISELFGIITLLSLFRNNFQSLWHRMLEIRRNRVILSAIGCVMAVMCVSILFWQKQLDNQDAEIKSQMVSSQYGTAYFDIIDDDVPKWWLLDQPVKGEWYMPFQYYALSRFAPKGKLYTVVPTALKGLTDSSDPGLELSKDFEGFYEYNGVLVSFDNNWATQNDEIPYHIAEHDDITVSICEWINGMYCFKTLFLTSSGNLCTYMKNFD